MQSNNRNSGSDWGDIGCLIIIGMLILPFALQAIFVALLPYLFVGGIGFVGYRLYIYDQRTRKITQYFEEQFNLSDKKKDVLELDSKTQKKLPQKDSEEIKLLKKEMKKLKKEQKEAKAKQKQEIEQALQQRTDSIGKQKKNEVLNDIFGDNKKDIARTDEFEKQQFQDKVKKKKDELEIRELKQDVNEKLFAQERSIYEFSNEAREDRSKIRQEMNEGFMIVDKRFMQVEKEFSDFKVYVGEKFSNLEIRFFTEINELKGFIKDVRTEFKQETSEIKLQFGKEILRLDKQQVKIVDRMQKYENQVRKFSIDMMKLKVDAERFALRGEELFKRASIVHERHKVQMEHASNKLQVGLEKMAVKNQSFANTVSSAKLRLDEISQEQYFTLKDMAYERVGINMLRQEHQQRASTEQLRMQNLVQQQRHLEGKISDKISRGKEVAGLQHQLHVTKEQLGYTSNRANLMRQENALMRRLTR